MHSKTVRDARHHVSSFALAMLFTAVVASPDLALAQDFAGADQKVCGFFDSINGLLNLASIAVVTIAVIFAGYQIAFAHKRISDVAPILIGGLLIGAAGQIAKMLIGDTGEQCGTSAMLMGALQAYA
jgi:type IV secretion system protein VirB2